MQIKGNYRWNKCISHIISSKITFIFIGNYRRNSLISRIFVRQIKVRSLEFQVKIAYFFFVFTSNWWDVVLFFLLLFLFFGIEEMIWDETKFIFFFFSSFSFWRWHEIKQYFVEKWTWRKFILLRLLQVKNEWTFFDIFQLFSHFFSVFFTWSPFSYTVNKGKTAAKPILPPELSILGPKWLFTCDTRA